VEIDKVGFCMQYCYKNRIKKLNPHLRVFRENLICSERVNRDCANARKY
jgi:hypothetical protein